jgi:AraC-like DNA-binding protein
MMSSSAETTWSFSSTALPPERRTAALQGLRERGIVRLEPLPDHLARVEIRKVSLPGFSILEGALGGLRQIAAPYDPLVGDDVFLGVNLAGRSIVHQGGRELVLDDGDAVFFSSAEKGFVIHRPTPVLFLGLRVPRKALALLAANLDGALLRLVTGRSAPLRLLTKYLRCVGADVADEPQILGRTVAAHVYDLIALIVGANADAVAAAEDRGVKAARLRAIKTDIARRLADGELTIADVAARQGVTLRYVHKLFEGEGASFSRYVLDRRLEAAYRVLTDQRQDHRSILSIAFDSGFADLSHFNRTFRRRYDATPTDVRFGRAV